MKKYARNRLLFFGIITGSICILFLNLYTHASEEKALPKEAMNTENHVLFNAEYLFQVGREGKNDDEFGGPFGVHLSNDGRLYVADDLGHSIKIFNKDGKFLQRIGEKGIAHGEFSYMDCVITDNSGLMYIADAGNNRIQILDSNGRYLKEIRRWGFLNMKGFQNPRDISTDKHGRLFVTDWGNHSVQVFGKDLQVFTKDGLGLGSFGKKGAGKGEFYKPTDLDISADGRLYVAEFGNHRIQVFQVH